MSPHRNLQHHTDSTLQDGKNRTELLNNLKQDDLGFIHFADDGIVRSYSENGTVIDYVPFNNALLMETVALNRPAYDNQTYQHLLDVFDGVDGHDVTDPQQIFNPPNWLRPPPQMPDSDDNNNDHAFSSASQDLPRRTTTSEHLFDKRLTDCNYGRCRSSVNCRIAGCSGCGYLDLSSNVKICFL